MILLFQKNKQGFTLVEIMVSVAIFAIVVTAGMGALTSMLHAHRASQAEKKAADNLSYLLENMTREIRLGDHYFAGLDGYQDSLMSGSTAAFSKNGSAHRTDGAFIGFNASDHRGYIVYYLKDGEFRKRFFKPNETVDESLTDKSQVIIQEARVSVMNAETVGDGKQPLVWIQLKAASPDNLGNERIIQTLVSQRSLDI